MSDYSTAFAIHLAKVGEFPPDFDQWEEQDDLGFSVAHYSLGNNCALPASFSNWGLATPSGWTVAHEAARCGLLPADFNDWALRDSNGVTVAHVAAGVSVLAPHFKHWELKDDNGLSVAHWAAMLDNIPEGFTQWFIEDHDGINVWITHQATLMDINEKGYGILNVPGQKPRFLSSL